MLGGLGFVLAALFSTVSTIGLGGVFVAIAWVKVLEMRTASAQWSIPVALYALSASVLVDPIGVFVDLRFFPLDLLPSREMFGIFLFYVVWSLTLIVSFSFLIACMVLVRRESGPGIRVMQIGSRVLFFTSLLGLIGIIVWLPGAPWYQSM